MTPKEVIDKWRVKGESYQWVDPDGKKTAMFSEEDVEKMITEALASAGDYQKVAFDLLLTGDVSYSVKPEEDFIVLRVWPNYATEANSHSFWLHKDDKPEGLLKNFLRSLLKKL